MRKAWLHLLGEHGYFRKSSCEHARSPASRVQRCSRTQRLRTLYVASKRVKASQYPTCGNQVHGSQRCGSVRSHNSTVTRGTHSHCAHSAVTKVELSIETRLGVAFMHKVSNGTYGLCLLHKGVFQGVRYSVMSQVTEEPWNEDQPRDYFPLGRCRCMFVLMS